MWRVAGGASEWELEQEEMLEALTMGHRATWWPSPQLVLLELFSNLVNEDHFTKFLRI
jgi:hypothetical protein